MAFDALLGNPALKTRLEAAARAGTLSHCYLLAGPRGSGKHTLAMLLAAAFECEGAAPPCMTCHACRKVLANTHPDVIVVDDTSRRTISVDRVREMVADAQIRPNEGRRKVYLLPRAQDLGPAGQNALLKLLEEPPDYAAFLLLAENPDLLLSTVRSRCVELSLGPLPRETLAAELRRRVPEAEAVDAAIVASGGFLGQALEALQGTGLTPEAAEFATAFAARDELALCRLFAGLEKWKREQFLPLLQTIQALLTDALKCSAGLPAASRAASALARRGGPDLARAESLIRTAMEYTNANVGVAHLCGLLAAHLRF